MAMGPSGGGERAVPYINVTPLIDVLLVLLIIFMVITPLKPTRFKALVPQQPPPDKNQDIKPNPLTLVVTIESDGKLKLNQEENMGQVTLDNGGQIQANTGALSKRLSDEFARRRANHSYDPNMVDRTDVPEEERIAKSVFIKAPSSIDYGRVVAVIDAVKGAGATPVGLQIDDLAK